MLSCFFLFCFSGIYQPNKIPLQTSSAGLASPSPARVVREPRHVGRTLLWKTETENRPRDTGSIPPSVSTMCPVLVNQSESIRLDNQLRGWFRLEPGTANNETTIDPAHSGFRKGDSSKSPIGHGSTALDHYTRPAVHSLTGSIYHMLLADREIRATKFG